MKRYYKYPDTKSGGVEPITPVSPGTGANSGVEIVNNPGNSGVLSQPVNSNDPNYPVYMKMYEDFANHFQEVSEITVDGGTPYKGQILSVYGNCVIINGKNVITGQRAYYRIYYYAIFSSTFYY